MLTGRDKEIEETIDAISKRKNLFLSGPSGVGKTFIVKHVLDETGVKANLGIGDCP